MAIHLIFPKYTVWENPNKTWTLQIESWIVYKKTLEELTKEGVSKGNNMKIKVISQEFDTLEDLLEELRARQLLSDVS